MDFTLADIEKLLHRVIQSELEPIREDIRDLKTRVSNIEIILDVMSQNIKDLQQEVFIIRHVEIPRLTKAVVAIAHHTGATSPEIQELEAAI